MSSDYVYDLEQNLHRFTIVFPFCHLHSSSRQISQLSFTVFIVCDILITLANDQKHFVATIIS